MQTPKEFGGYQCRVIGAVQGPMTIYKMGAGIIKGVEELNVIVYMCQFISAFFY